MVNSRATGKITVLVKKVNETVNNSATAQADDELKFTAKANKTYYIRLCLFISSGTTPDIKTALTLPSGATAKRATGILGQGVLIATADWTSLFTIGCDGNQQMMKVEGRVIISSTAGEVALSWAQGTQDASDTIMLSGSSMEIYEETT